MGGNLLSFPCGHISFYGKDCTINSAIDLLQKVPHHGIDLWLQVQIFYDHVNPVTRRTIDQSAGGKLRDQNAEESWALLEDLALYDNESWNDPRDFAKPVKAIALSQDVPMDACHDTKYCMEEPNKSLLTNVKPRVPTRSAGVLSARSYPTEDPQCSTHIHGSINAITIHPKQQIDSRDDEPAESEEEEKVTRANSPLKTLSIYDINTPKDEITREQDNRKQYRVSPGRYVPTRLKWKIAR
ncbi:hypothetical protein Tco_0461763 [Tanacetum coccineum]